MLSNFSLIVFCLPKTGVEPDVEALADAEVECLDNPRISTSTKRFLDGVVFSNSSRTLVLRRP